MKKLIIKNRDAILNRANKYYENNKEVLREIAKNKNRKLSEEQKNTKREYGRNKYHKMFAEKKTKRISKTLSWDWKISI